jgi:hypothetical protein
MSKLVAGIVAVASLIFAAPAAAITNGQADGNGHPEVGALLAQQAFSDGTWAECTGTLISRTVFLTAAHCDEGVSQVSVTFDSAYTSSTGRTYSGVWHADPAFSKANGDPHDIAVVVFSNPIPGITPANLPGANSLAGLGKNQQFTSVGYGAQARSTAKGPKTFTYTDTRFVAAGTLNAVTPAFLRVSQNASHGDGGTCYGDSGGPNFLGAGSGETRTIAATTITGDTACRSTNVDFRLDTPAARKFLSDYVPLP